MKKESVRINSLGDTLAGTLFLPDSHATTPEAATAPALMPATATAVMAARVPALIVCHGAGDFKENFFELAECVAAKSNVAVLCLDMHGHGASGGNRFHVNMNEWKSDIRSAVSFLSDDPRIDGKNIHAFGFSSGGTAVLEFAIDQSRANSSMPARKAEESETAHAAELKSVIALDATVRDLFPFFERIALKTLVLIGRIKRAVTGTDLRLPFAKLSKHTHLASDINLNSRIESDSRFTSALNSFPLPGAAQAFFTDTLKRVHLIQIPTLVLWGEKDEIDPQETAKLLYEALTCVKELHVIPENGHVGHLDTNKKKVFGLIGKWLDDTKAN